MRPRPPFVSHVYTYAIHICMSPASALCVWVQRCAGECMARRGRAGARGGIGHGERARLETGWGMGALARLARRQTQATHEHSLERQDQTRQRPGRQAGRQAAANLGAMRHMCMHPCMHACMYLCIAGDKVPRAPCDEPLSQIVRSLPRAWSESRIGRRSPWPRHRARRLAHRHGSLRKPAPTARIGPRHCRSSCPARCSQGALTIAAAQQPPHLAVRR